MNSTRGFGDLGVGERVARFCRDRALILPVARLQLGGHDAAAYGGLLGGFAALTGVVSLRDVTSAAGRRETLTKAIAASGRLEPGTNLGAWLHRIMINAFISDHRKKRREARLPQARREA